MAFWYLSPSNVFDLKCGTHDCLTFVVLDCNFVGSLAQWIGWLVCVQLIGCVVVFVGRWWWGKYRV